MKWKLLTVLFAAMLVLAACGGGGDDEGSSDDSGGDTTTEEQEGMDEGSEDSGGEMDSAAAEEAFQANCASCHGGDLGGGVGPALDSVGANYSEDEIMDIIQNGKGDMPAQNVDDETAQQVAGWLAQMK